LTITHLIATLISLLIAIDVHEFAHAWAADRLGDPTARYMGRLSLNPIVHLDPLGTIMMLASFVYGFGIGWGKPVPVNPIYLRYGPRLGMGMVAAAGPLSNLLLAALAAVPFRLGIPMPRLVLVMVFTFIGINIGLALFNLLPIPPLDGASVLQGILSTIRAPWAYRLSATLTQLEHQGPIIFVLLIMIDRILPGPGILGLILGPPFHLLWRLFVGG